MAQCLATVYRQDNPATKATQVEVFSIIELDKVLDFVAATCPPYRPRIADVVRSNGDVLSIGLGEARFRDDQGKTCDLVLEEPLSILSFVACDHNSPYYLAVSRQPLPCNIVFYYGGHLTELPGSAAIPLEDAREAVRRFVVSDDLPDNLLWGEV